MVLMAVVWPRNLTKIPDQHTDEIISIFFFFFFGKACVILRRHCSKPAFLQVMGSRPWAPEDDSSIGRGGEEGLVVGVPSTLDHFIPVLSCHRLGEGLCEVTFG